MCQFNVPETAYRYDAEALSFSYSYSYLRGWSEECLPWKHAPTQTCEGISTGTRLVHFGFIIVVSME